MISVIRRLLVPILAGLVAIPAIAQNAVPLPAGNPAQLRAFEGAVASLLTQVRQGSLVRPQYKEQCQRAIDATLKLPAQDPAASQAMNYCTRAIDDLEVALQRERDQQFDQARKLMTAAGDTLALDANVSSVCRQAAAPMAAAHPRRDEFLQACQTYLGNRLLQAQLNNADHGGDHAPSNCGNLFKPGPANKPRESNPAAMGCLVRWFMNNAACEGDKCRARLDVGDKQLWIHPPRLSGETLLLPSDGYVLRLANKVTIDVSVIVPKKLDTQLRFETESGTLKEITATGIRKQEVAAAVGLQIGESLVVVGASFIPLIGVGDTVGAVMPIVDAVATHYMSEHFDQKHQAAIVSEDAKAATAAASTLAGVYNTLYRLLRKKTNFVSHVCFEAGSTDGKYTAFLNGRKSAPALAFQPRCRDHERWEVWSNSRRDGTLQDGDQVFLRSYQGAWLSSSNEGGGQVRLVNGDIKGSLSQFLWRVVTGDGKRIIESVGPPTYSAVYTPPPAVYLPDEACQPPTRGDRCAVPVRLQSMATGKWLHVAPDNKLAGVMFGVFDKTHVALVATPPGGASQDSPYAGYLALHRWYGSGACVRGDKARQINCLAVADRFNEVYSAGY